MDRFTEPGDPHPTTLGDEGRGPGAARASVYAAMAFFGTVLLLRGIMRLAFEPPARREWTSLLALGVGALLVLPQIRWSLWIGRRVHRFRSGCCIHCAYPTSGIERGVCPECGRDPFLDGL
ncbi:MAG: hypothetical protein IPJ41_00940 [Phycisphaerales bacterium]|nr:hypothetical protein [Phycisphaerales bacterium]